MSTPTPPLAREAEPMSVKQHSKDCDWHTDQYAFECTCGAVTLDERFAMLRAAIKRLRSSADQAMVGVHVSGLQATIAILKRERDEARAEGFRQGRDAAAKVMRQLREALPPLAKCSWNGACESGDQAIRALQPPKEP